VAHEIKCEPAGSELKLGKAVAKFTSTESVELGSKKAWRAKA
jgi:hypothetical protein